MKRLSLFSICAILAISLSACGGGGGGGGGDNGGVPSTSITSHPADVTNSKVGSFGFTSDDSNSTFQCEIDNGSFDVCTTPQDYTGMADGEHTFCVEAINNVGPDPTPECYTWKVDTVAPINTSSVDFINGGDAKTNTKTVTLQLSAQDDVGVAGYFVAENDTGIPPAPPAADDSGWVSIPSTATYNEGVFYTFKNDYVSGTKVHLYILFKDQAGNISASVVPDFFDDFESGMLSNWIIGGRQQGTNIAEIVFRNSSSEAHLRHQDFTEVTLEKTFPLNPEMNFSFQMETAVSSQASNTSDFLANGGVIFDFYNSSDSIIGSVGYIRSTSSWVFDNHCAIAFTNQICHLNKITNSGIVNYSITISELLDQVAIPDPIESVKLTFDAYASGWPYNMSADVWLDNFALVKLTNGWDSIVYDTAP
jgi:hypothetical protein